MTAAQEPRPAGTPEDRTPAELREDLVGLRTDLGDTVEELANRVDVPARVRAKRDETTEKLQHQVERARGVLAERAPAVEKAISGRPVVVGAVAVLAALLLVRGLRRRSGT